MSTLSEANLEHLALVPQVAQGLGFVSSREKANLVVGEVAIRLADLPRWRPTINVESITPDGDDE